MNTLIKTPQKVFLFFKAFSIRTKARTPGTKTMIEHVAKEVSTIFS